MISSSARSPSILSRSLARELIGWPDLLSSISTNITGGRGQSMNLCADQGYMANHWSSLHGVNAGWWIDDFAADNGATCFLPGSNDWNGERQNEFEEYRDQLMPIEAPTGSALIMKDG